MDLRYSEQVTKTKEVVVRERERPIEQVVPKLRRMRGGANDDDPR